MTVQAGERLGLFARTGQLSLKSGEGAVDVHISFAGKKRITLIGGGSYLRLEAGKIEYGTMATYLRRTKRTMVAAPATMPLPIPLLLDLYPPLNGQI